MARISWLIPVRDEPRLADAVASVAAELGPDDEVIVVDDGSVTPVDAGALPVPTRALRVVRQGRLGIVAALNAGLERARGTWIARMDADDLVLPGRIEAQVAAMTAGVVAVGGRVRTDAVGMAAYVAWVNANDPMAERTVESPLVHPASLLRASAVREVGGYRLAAAGAPHFPEDYDLFLRLADVGRLTRVDREVLYWRDGPGRLTRTDLRYSSPASVPLKRRWLAPRVAGRRAAVLGGAEGGWAEWLVEVGATPAALGQADLALLAPMDAEERGRLRAVVQASRPDLREGEGVWAVG